MIIKVCGMRESENVKELANLPIDLMGMIYYKKSARFIGTETLDFASGKKRVGVFVNEELEAIRTVVAKDNLEYVQLHGDEAPEFCKSVQQFSKVIKVFRVSENFDFHQTLQFDFCDLFLFDTSTKSYGGSGRKFDWEQLQAYKGVTAFLLSGGIGPDDVSSIKAVEHSQFAGVDLNSQFEIEPGLKNIQALKTFIHELSS